MPDSGDSVPLVSDWNDQHEDRIFLYFVQHSTIADEEPPEAPKIALQASPHHRVVGEPIDCCYNSRPVWLGDAPQFPDRPPLIRIE